MSTEILPDAPKPAHTPGPWKFETHGTGFISDSAHMGIAIILSDFEGYAMPQVANAHLLAAAPDLLRGNRVAAVAIAQLLAEVRAAIETAQTANEIDSEELLIARDLENELQTIVADLDDIARRAQGDAQ